MKIWVTRYALTSGVTVHEPDEVEINDTRFWWYEGHWLYAYSKADAHTTRDAAVARVEKMRIAKITSLEKQIKRLKSLVIDVPE